MAIAGLVGLRLKFNTSIVLRENNSFPFI